MNPEVNTSELQTQTETPCESAETPIVDEAPETEEAPDEVVAEKPKRKQPLVLKIASVLLGAFAVVCIILRLALSRSESASEVFYMNITRPLQAFFGAVSSVIPFSLAETLVILLVPICIIVLASMIRCLIRRDVFRLCRTLLSLSTVASLVISTYILNLSVLYCRPSLSDLSGIGNEAPVAEDLYVASLVSVLKLDALTKSGAFAFADSGASVCPYDFAELDERINLAFDKYAVENPWISPHGARAKIISLSDYMTYTHIAGMYTPYTGESNININYPEYIVTSTIAHEKAHQRGIGPEDEANLVAFFVLAESGDPYLEYCGYMSVFYELMGACRDSSVSVYANNVLPYIPECVIKEFAAYNAFFKPYVKSTASRVANTVNDTYLKLNGESDGIKSYGMTVDMTVAYIIDAFDLEAD